MNLVEQLKELESKFKGKPYTPEMEAALSEYTDFSRLLEYSIYASFTTTSWYEESDLPLLPIKIISKECDDGQYMEFTFEHEGRFYKATADHSSWTMDGNIEFNGFNDLREVKPVQKMATFYEEIE